MAHRTAGPAGGHAQL